MSESRVTRDGVEGARPAPEARMWSKGRARRGGGRRGEQLMVPDATFTSYYGRAVVKKPVWSELDIGGYLFTGGIAAGSALIAAGADLTARPRMRRAGRLSALVAITVSAGALVHDLGVRSRFHHMLRVAKPTSAMSVGSWLLTAFSAPLGVAAAAEVPALLPPPLRRPIAALARPAGLAAAAVAPGIATYTAVLICDTAIPSWHAAYPEMPFVFAGSALSGSAGLALVLSPCAESVPIRRLAILGAALELASSRHIEQRLGLLAEPYEQGKPGRKMRAAKALTAAAALGAVVAAGRHRTSAIICGASLFASSALTRFAIFEAGVASAEDPKYVVAPQRERIERGEAGGA